jgi:ribosomal protein S18 acetylase RimI-like enzyme
LARTRTHLLRLVATIDDRVAGTVRYRVENQSVRVVGLGVHPDFRRRGVARALLRCLEEIGKAARATRLHLYTVRQTGNVDVFRRLGFTVIAQREAEFSESDRYEKLTDVELEKRLEPGGPA